MSKIRTFSWSSRTTERLKSEQNGSDFRHCVKPELFGNGTTLESAEIQMFGFQTVTVLDQYNSRFQTLTWSIFLQNGFRLMYKYKPYF